MSLLDCKKLRFIVIFAGILFLLGIALQMPRMLLGSELPAITTLLSGGGLLAMVLSPALMLLVALLALLPNVARSLNLCEH